MGYRGWRLWLCRIGWHTRTEQTLHTVMCAYCYTDLRSNTDA